MTIPPKILELVERFARSAPVYCSGQYNETQARHEFIDPFFSALGWDVNNEQGYAEPYKDVVHEDVVRVGGVTKAPDYSFRIGGTRKFFVEAKRPGVNLRDDPEPAFQLRRYAWSAKLPLSVLTDFDEFVVYDCRVKPRLSDKASAARVLYVGHAEYAQRWDEIAGIFSREAVLRGSFDRYAASSRLKKGTAEVDNAFLHEIESWREVLARNMALRNPALSQRELNYAVQMLIDRIIFLRIAEDRGIEPYGRLQALLNGTQVYGRLLELFRLADDRYNSGLFYFRPEKGRPETPDTLSPNLAVDDRVLQDILRGLYYPDSPYEFSVLPADILGQVYEQFLGQVIRLTAGHRAVVEAKPEVKKAGGVYYTPTYIVDYIVQHTVGALLAGQKPRQAAGLKILDPACGSGSFLLGAYQYLLDWYRDEYAREPARHARGRSPCLYEHGPGDWRLTTAERKRILLAHIYGVDIDPQAVEVTKLSLLLKVLEGESEQTLQPQLLHERALPDLGHNIKCGNSLIGPDYFQGRQASFLEDDEEHLRVNPFDWEREFPEILSPPPAGGPGGAGGFDVVIGNPPWGATFEERDLHYMRANYRLAKSSTVDSYALFIELGLRRLGRGGVLSYITPDTFLRKDDHLQTRQLLLEETCIRELIETGPVFSKVRDTWCLVFCVEKARPESSDQILHRKISRFVVSAEERLDRFGRGAWDAESRVLQAIWQQRPKLIVGYLTSEPQQRLIAKIEHHPTIGQLAAKYRISRGEEGSKFALQEQAHGGFFIVIPKDVERYCVADGLRVSENSLTNTKVASLYKHPKIWCIRIQKMRWRQRIVCAFDGRTNSAGMKTLQIIVSPTDSIGDLKYLLGILASSLVNFWCLNYLADDMNQSYLEKIPIRPIDLADPADAGRHARMVELVEGMLELHRRLAAARTPHERTRLERQITATDREIDLVVYELYELTAEEIGIVEGTA